MRNLKLTLSRYAEFYFIGLALMLGYTPPFAITLPAVILAAIFLLQFIFKNQYTGVALSSIVIALSAYLVLALVSELSHFPTFNSSAWLMLGVGSAIIIGNCIMATLMMRKYSAKHEFAAVRVKS